MHLLLAHWQDRTDVAYVVTRYLRYVQQARHAANIDECAVRLDSSNNTRKDGADREVLDLLVNHGLAVRHDQPVVFFVDVKKLDIQRGAH